MKIKIKTNYNLDEFTDKKESVNNSSLTEPDDDFTVPELIYLFQTGQRRATGGSFDYSYNSEEDYVNDDIDLEESEPCQVFDKDVADANEDLKRMASKVLKARESKAKAKPSENVVKASASVSGDSEQATSEGEAPVSSK